MQCDKILGTLYGAAYGDSLGAITEFCSREEISKAFPQECTEYAASISFITKGITPGTVTDDFGSSCYFMKAIVKHQGAFSREIAMEAILDWADDEIVFARYAGQNTKEAIIRLKQGIVIDEMSKARHFSRANTNGGAMKASPLGLLAHGNKEKAIDYALAMCWPTHYNSAAASAASAIACAVCEAMSETATLDSIVEQAIYGARIARQRLEKEGFASMGPYVDVKIREAAALGKTSTGYFDTIEMLNGSIGTNIWVQESIPAVFAIIMACRGDFAESVKCAVNAGGDTDTISSMVGAILGGYHGIYCVPKDVIERIQHVNQFLHLKEVIHDFTNLLLNKGG